ncbi:MAG TPA: FHA domain-containing protein [Thermoanaerobaculia bacterium]|nr:FHA domain-containing protein [Thermoanaerobaculia bacterium]
MSKICPQCKTVNRDQANFCMSCNARLAADTPVRYCPAGKHPMDPGWDTCPYCAASGQPAGPPPLPGRGRTLVEDQEPAGAAAPYPPAPPPPAAPFPAAAAGSPPPPPPAGGAGRRKTVFDSGPAAQEAPGSESGLRRIVGVLVTYTWKPEGQLFAVREGRNYLGRDLECEVAIPGDSQMSSRHATIVYRGNDFWIDDEKSMNGTLVDGESVEEKQRLPDGAAIRTGATVWRFVQLPKADR